MKVFQASTAGRKPPAEKEVKNAKNILFFNK